MPYRKVRRFAKAAYGPRVVVPGKDNGWKILDFLKTATHPNLVWKTDDEWAEYYQEHKTSESSHFTEKEYVNHMRRKRYEGMFGGTVFTLFTTEEANKTGVESYTYTDPQTDVINDIMFCIRDRPTSQDLDVVECS